MRGGHGMGVCGYAYAVVLYVRGMGWVCGVYVYHPFGGGSGV